MKDTQIVIHNIQAEIEQFGILKHIGTNHFGLNREQNFYKN